MATVLGIFAIEVAKNASGEIYDFDSGADLAIAAADRSPFSGGKRVLVDGLLTRRETVWIAVTGYALGMIFGFAVAFLREPGILWIGMGGVACAYFYHAPPFKLAYRGWGELAVGVCYGPLIALGTFIVQAGSISLSLILTAIPLGMLIAAFLWINEFPDARADARSGKRTMVVRLGRKRASRIFALLVLFAFGWLAWLPLEGLPRGIWLGLMAAWPATLAARRLWWHYDRTPDVIPAQSQTLLSFVLYAVGVGIGFLFA